MKRASDSRACFELAFVGAVIALMVAAVSSSAQNRGAATSLRPVATEPASVTVADDSLQLFRDDNFKNDTSAVDGVTKNNAPGKAIDLPKNLGDSLTSLRWNLPAGVIVVFYEDAGAKGETFTIWGQGQVKDLKVFDFSDKASRWAWYYLGGVDNAPEHIRKGLSTAPLRVKAPDGPMSDDTLQLYRDKNYKDTASIVNHVTATPTGQLQSLPSDLSDSMTSLRWNLPQGVVVVLYQNSDGKKQQASIWGKGQISDVDIFDFNDKVSRWAWYQIGSPKLSASAEH